MKICIPTKTQDGKKAEVYEHFGSAPFFTIYDMESGTVEVIDNANQHHDHGRCQPLSAFADKHIDVVVTGGMGARALQKLNEGGINAFRAVPGTVLEIVEQFSQGRLEAITVNNACAHQGGCHPEG
jgi:predicted Fe-Mo cluster-binding NifX family protein